MRSWVEAYASVQNQCAAQWSAIPNARLNRVSAFSLCGSRVSPAGAATAVFTGRAVEDISVLLFGLRSHIAHRGEAQPKHRLGEWGVLSKVILELGSVTQTPRFPH